MEHIFSAIIPVFSLILLGYYFKRIRFPSQDFWPMADKLTYFVLMPSLLIYKLSSAKISLDSVNFLIATLLAILVTTIILMVLNKLRPTSKPAFTSIVQGGIRFNTYVFLALCDSIFGNSGLILAAIILTFAIPFINIICVSIFALYSNNDKLDFKYLVKSIVTNPLIIGCFIGGMINLLEINLHVSFKNFLSILANAALPLGLISVGYALVIKEIKNSKKDLMVSSIAKFLILPFFMYFFAQLLGLNDLMVNILVLFGLMPTASSSFILARQLGGDIALMTRIITVQTLISILFIVLYLKIFI